MGDFVAPNGDVFRMEADLIDVSMLHRPDTSWRVTDTHGHEHCWYVGEKPADYYSPQMRYHTPTLVEVEDADGWYDDDGGFHHYTHDECAQCGERIDPRYTSDDCAQYIQGLTRRYINDEPVTEEEFLRRGRAAFPELFKNVDL